MMEQPSRQHIGGAAVEGDKHIAVPLMESLHEHRQITPFISPQIPHPQAAAEPHRSVMHPPSGLAHPLQDGLCLQQEHFPRQLADLLGDGGLGDVKLLRRLGEAAGLGGGDEIF